MTKRIKECIPLLLENRDLTSDDVKAATEEIMQGEETASQVAVIPIALEKEGETVSEVTAFAQVIREFRR